jgi:hypothetical protein
MTLGQLWSWNTNLTEPLSRFAVTVLMASIFGQCTRYCLRRQTGDETEFPPWDARSTFATINSSLLLLESYTRLGTWSIAEIAFQNTRPDGTIDQQQVGHIVFAHALFHLCHCLLCHPFLLRLRLNKFGPNIPTSFLSRAIHVGAENARQLLELLGKASEAGILIETSSYSYCVALAGAICLLLYHFDSQMGKQGPLDSLFYFQRSLEILDRLSCVWPHAFNIVCPRLSRQVLRSNSL